MINWYIPVVSQVANQLNSNVIVCTPPLSAGRGVEPPTKFSKRGDLTGPQLLEGVAGKEGVTFFRGLQLSHKK